MASLLGQFVQKFVLVVGIAVVAACSSVPSGAAPYAAYVMDARTGETLYSKNADTRLHPASLTKMMTLYLAFEAIERGEISLDTMVTVSKNASSEPPSKLGLKTGQKIALRYLIRAAAVKSANDAATAIGEAVGGSEDQFAARMNRTAKAIGMRNTTFRNANGLTKDGHLSTAHDMSILGRRLFYDFPQYYNIFSRRSTDAGVAEVANTNRRFLDSYKGADGIKTGYTNPAGFNLTASAERGKTRIIATVFGGTSTAQRNAKVAELLDLGFKTAPANANVNAPAAPVYEVEPAPPVDALVAELQAGGEGSSGAKTLRMNTAVKTSLMPRSRPGSDAPAAVQVAEASTPEAAATEQAVAAMQDDIAGALAEATNIAINDALAEVVAAETAPEEIPFEVVTEIATETDEIVGEATNIVSLASVPAPKPRPEDQPVQLASAIIHTATPLVQTAQADPVPTAPEVVTRISTSGGRHWGVNIGRFPSRAKAERALMQTMLSESAALNDGLRKIVQRSGGYDANFMGLTQDQADLACRRIQARGTQCFAIGP